MKTGRVPTHCTLYADESLKIIPSSSRGQKIEMQQGGVTQHSEGPLVRIRNEWDSLVLQDCAPLFTGRKCVWQMVE